MKYFKSAFVFLFLMTCFIGAGFSQSKSSGKITGTIIDSTTKSPIEHVALSLLKDSTVISGAETLPDGNFTIDNIPNGTYDLRI